MADRTSIEWCDATFNPWIGCTKVSPGCDNCYAARQDGFRKWTPAGWGAGHPRRRTQTWGEPEKWNKRPFFECPDCGLRGDAQAMGDEPKTCRHLNAKPARMRVFCASLADVFDNEVDPAWQSDLFDLIRATANLDWLLLTKRIGNAEKLLASGILMEQFPNVWLGATVVNQEEADRDIPKLLRIPARVRFLSMEPLVGRVDLCEILGMWWNQTMGCFESTSSVGFNRNQRNTADRALDWIIVGGESGPGARPMHPGWARSLRDQCAAAGVPFLFKQWGEWDEANFRDPTPPIRHVWPDGKLMVKVGKKAAGRLLDGVEHNGFPEVRHA